MSKHTPTPWKTDAMYIVAEVPTGRPGGEVIVDCTPMVHRLQRDRNLVPVEANAAFIVRACNAHEELVEALEDALNELQQLDGTFGFSVSAAVETARAALATARGAGSEDD